MRLTANAERSRGRTERLTVDAPGHTSKGTHDKTAAANAKNAHAPIPGGAVEGLPSSLCTLTQSVTNIQRGPERVERVMTGAAAAAAEARPSGGAVSPKGCRPHRAHSRERA